MESAIIKLSRKTLLKRYITCDSKQLLLFAFAHQWNPAIASYISA